MAGKELLAKLKTEKELELTVKGRTTGRNLPRPVWFVVKDDEMLLLPVNGSSTQWYKNIVQNPQVTIHIKGLTHFEQNSNNNVKEGSIVNRRALREKVRGC